MKGLNRQIKDADTDTESTNREMKEGFIYKIIL